MSGKTHAVIGANAAWIAVALGVHVFPVSILAGVGAVAALLPDIEATYAKIHTLFGGAGAIGRHTFKHRGFTHSYLAVVCILTASSFLMFVDVLLPLVITLAYLSHLILDGLNTTSTQYLYPVKKRYWLLPKVLRSKVNGPVDHVLFILGMSSLIFLLLTTITPVI